MPRISNKNAAEAKQALALIASAIETMTGTDDFPSPLWDALSKLPGTDDDAWELAQDSALMTAAILDAIAANLQTPQMLLWEILTIVSQYIPELKDDIDALRN